jgi:hypothetical protein
MKNKGKLAIAVLGMASVTVASATKASAQNYLPYPADKSYPVTQTWNGSTSHTDFYNKYAVDFGMSVNQPVVAVAPGRVIHAWSGGSNLPRGCNRAYINNANYVVIDHGNNNSSIYVHLNTVSVAIGQAVTQGQQIGLSGDTGWTCNWNGTGTGPHLHFSFQKTNLSRAFWESISGGFVETNNKQPTQGVSYTSQNRGIPAAALMVNQATGRALDAGGANGTQLYLHPTPTSGNNYQIWSFQPVGNNEYMIINRATGRALDAGGANGSGVYPHPTPTSGNNYHRWKLQPSGNGYLVISVATGRALDAGGANYGVYMYPTPMPGNNYQIWRLQ